MYSACRPFRKNKERILKFRETGDARCIYQNELDKACFQNVMVYGDFKHLTRTASDKILRDKALKTRNMIDINVSFKFFDKKPSVSGIKNENISDQRLAEKLHKPVIRKFEKRKVQAMFWVLIFLICN